VTLNIPAAQMGVGNVTLSAAYTPDAGSSGIYNPANGTAASAVSVGAGTPTVTVTPASTSITPAQSLNVTVALNGGSGPTPTGSIVLTGGGYTSAATALTAGSATINIPAGSLALGSDTLTAAYTPDAGSAAIYVVTSGTTSTPVNVGKLTPTVAVAPASFAITTIDPLTVAVTLSTGSGNPTPTGSVTLTGGGYTSPATALTAGAVTFNLPAGSLAAGSDPLTASYTPDAAGSAAFNAATGTTANPVIVSRVTPSVTVSPASSAITTLQPLMVAVAVSGGSGAPAATGTVILSGGGYTSPATALSSGAATFNLPAQTLAAGSVTFSATYTPDTAGGAIYNAGAGTAANPVVVSKVTPTIVVASSQNPADVSKAVTFTATVSSGSAGVMPTGSVTFFDGITQLGSGAITAGMATYTAASLSEGAHSITAQYSGDAVFAGITSAVLTQTMTSLTIVPGAGAPTEITTGTGGVFDFPVNVTAPASNDVTFSATGLPDGSTVTFLPPTLAAGSGTTKVDVVVHLPGATAVNQAPGKPGAALPFAFALVLLPFLGLRRRVKRYLLPAVLLAAGLVGSIALSGCAHHQAPTPVKVAPGIYTMTVTATAGAQSQSTSVKVNVVN
jgi:hypothetical protein